jgi:hypothetical protein
MIFGGILEITKELNDLHLFDLTKKNWVTLFDESNSPVRGRERSPTFQDPQGEGLHSSLGATTTLGGGSPSLYGRKSIITSN